MSQTRIIQLPDASSLTPSTYLIGDNMGGGDTVKFNYILLGTTLAQTVFADKMLTDSELTTLEQLLNINS